LDERTVHLDLEKPEEIKMALHDMEIMVVSIAHRIGMVDGADEIVRV
jgi:ABC-type bacteriocin/lantibiotic exporter with double-glycine peptidase domain